MERVLLMILCTARFNQEAEERLCHARQGLHPVWCSPGRDRFVKTKFTSIEHDVFQSGTLAADSCTPPSRELREVGDAALGRSALAITS
eukprot:scaffold55116_cov39-Phaeocystis_antarctica.AAC.1